jgi:diguanylate cyclase (GGDEF)-like protein
MTFSLKFLQSKVARRIFLLFILCALIPILTLALVSYRLVVHQLNTQTQERLHQASKETALSIFERLLFVESQMRDVAYKVKTEGIPSPDEFGPTLSNYFRNMYILTGTGKTVKLFGSPRIPPDPTSDELNHLKSGNTLLSIQDGGPLPLPLFMRRLLDPEQQKSGVLIAELNPDFVWGMSDETVAQPAVEVFLSTHAEMVPLISIPKDAAIPESTASRMTDSFSGQLDWTYNGDRFTASYWSVFLKNNFFMPKWTVVLSKSKSDVLAPLVNFKKVFLLVFLLSLWIVLLLSISQIRRNLGPIEKLRDATRRIANSDFDVPVTITSGDEFEELADSFNAMSGRLNKQFRAIAGAADFDRVILSSLDTGQIVEAVLAGMPDMMPCDCVAVTLHQKESDYVTRISYHMHETPSETTETAHRILPEDEEKLRLHQEHIVSSFDSDTPAFLGPMIQRGIRSFLLLPVILKDTLEAVITLGHVTPLNRNPDDLSYVRQMVNQVAVALSNARMVEQIHVLAYYDTLTGLPNRVRFKEQLNRELLLAGRRRQSVAILFLDLDNFKHINDTLGHDLGDRLLQEVTSRLLKWIRFSDFPSRANKDHTIVSRLGGDEFTLYLSDLQHAQDAARVAQRILDVLSKAFMLDSHEVFITASIGITVFPLDGKDGDTLLKNADTAMYHAKDQGKNNYQFFTPSMNAAVTKRLSLENDLRKALERREFVLYYQPQWDLATGRLFGMEALIRWWHPQQGLVFPSEFIPLAEETGLVVPMGLWALREACEQNKALQEAGLPPVRVSVNLSGKQILDPQLPDIVAGCLKHTGLDARFLEVELTESILMERQKTTLTTLQTLREMGIRIALDDFGTGFSSLSYLNSLPVDTLKIDKSFVNHIPAKADSVALIRAIIAMAHSLKLRVLAEGVESEEQRDFLREEGCNEVQGNLYSAAVPITEIEKLLRMEDRPRTA